MSTDIATAGLKQDAVVWALTGHDNEGQPIYGSPTAIKVRWEFTKREIRGPKGSPIQLSAEVMVCSEIETGSQMWFGCIDNLPTTPTDLHEVINYDETPDVEGRNPQRNVQLVRK